MKALYDFYDRHVDNRLVTTAAFLGWGLGRALTGKRPPDTVESFPGKRGVKLALLCDQMTFEAFRGECGVCLVTPRNYEAVLRDYRPDLLLCESAWVGSNGDWWLRGVYRNRYALYDNRRALLGLLAAFRREGVPTVFWNKEDPAYFGSQRHDFVDTALRCDYIFTTAEECVPEYEKRGHDRVYVLPFGFSPRLFNPLGSGIQREEAVFAGSWYADQPRRGQELETLFARLEECGIPYTIYDRHCTTGPADSNFPARYHDHIRPALPYDQLSAATRPCRYAVNINTVTGSDTMFARRVYEMMAENHTILSNRAAGLERAFPDRIWYVDQPAPPADDRRVRRQNLEEVFLRHTWGRRLEYLLETVGLPVSAVTPPLCLLLPASRGAEAAQAELAYPCVSWLLWDETGLRTPSGEPAELPTEGYVAVLDRTARAEDVNWRFLLAQYEYLPPDCGIRWGQPLYTIVTDGDGRDCLFPAAALGPWPGALRRSVPKLLL